VTIPTFFAFGTAIPHYARLSLAEIKAEVAREQARWRAIMAPREAPQALPAARATPNLPASNPRLRVL